MSYAFVHATLTSYLDILEQFGLLGVVILMAMQSTVFPVPSEIVVPPATYLALLRWENAPLLAMLVVAGTATTGCYLGAGLTYWVARGVGRPIIVRYGKYFFVPEKKLSMAEAWVAKYGAAGIFLACLVPGVRSFHSIPAGLMRMPFGRFSFMLVTGSALWCSILTVFGWLMAGSLRKLLESGADPAAASEYHAAFRTLTLITLGLVAVILLVYVILVMRRRRARARNRDTEAALVSSREEG